MSLSTFDAVSTSSCFTLVLGREPLEKQSKFTFQQEKNVLTSSLDVVSDP